MNPAIKIRRAKAEDDADYIWQIIKTVIASGDTYAFAPDSSREEMMNFWCGPDRHTYVATIDDKIVGTFVIKDNLPGLGAHTANAGFMTAPDYRGRGIGKTMGTYSLEEAKRLGYRAMQFNFVVQSNERAVRLWKSLGFTIIGEIPEAFDHQELGWTNVYIMWRRL